MSYALSQLDKDNFSWFAHDKARNSLVGIKVDKGNIIYINNKIYIE